MDSPKPWTELGTDAPLLAAAQRGDLASWLQLVRVHRLPLWRACLAITRDRADAEALFQETLASATRQVQTAPSGRAVLPWFVRMARELDANRQRTRGMRPTVGATRPNGEPWIEGAQGAAYIQDEKKALHAFALLHSDDQWLLTLRIVERLSYADISQITGLPVPRVMSRIALAREYLDHMTGLEGLAA